MLLPPTNIFILNASLDFALLGSFQPASFGSSREFLHGARTKERWLTYCRQLVLVARTRRRSARKKAQECADRLPARQARDANCLPRRFTGAIHSHAGDDKRTGGWQKIEMEKKYVEWRCSMDGCHIYWGIFRIVLYNFKKTCFEKSHRLTHRANWKFIQFAPLFDVTLAKIPYSRFDFISNHCGL